MTPHESLSREITRIQNQLESTESPDPIDIAVVEALKSEEVQEPLLSILGSGAVLSGCEMQAAGSIAGIVQLTFLTEWVPGTSHITQAPVVSAMVEISPPRVIKAVQHAPATQPTASSFAKPTGLAPVALQDLTIPSAKEAYDFQLEEVRTLLEWLERERYRDRIPKGTGFAYSSTGTKCTSLFCFEKTSDDSDF